MEAKRTLAIRMMWVACWAAVIVVWAVFISLLVWRNETSVLKIEVPNSDRRVYKEIQLDNGLQVLLVQDNSADRAAAAMSVAAGSNQEWMPGLAHLTEHMLFYASAVFPKEDGLRLFLGSHGGDTNAYTDAEETNYYFYVDHGSLKQSLKMFGAAFTSPVFTQDMVSREILAVNSEHQKNVYNDDWRLNRLVELMAGQQHPFSHFSTGSVDTLQSDQLATEVHKFFDRFYRTPNLKLVVLGRDKVSRLAEWVRDAFSAVPNGPELKFDYEAPFPVKSKLVITQKVAPGHQLSIVWPLASQLQHVDEQPGDFIRYLLTNPGSGGLKAQMPEHVVGVASEVMWNYSDFSGLILQLELTPAGIKVWDTVASKVHGYLDLIAQTDEQTLRMLWEDYSRLSSINFYYSEALAPEDLVSSLASHMQKFSSANYLAGFNLKRKFDFELIQQTLGGMHPGDGLYFLACDKAGSGGTLGSLQLSLDQYEENYDLAYQVIKASLTSLSADFALPAQNAHIPSDFSIKSCPGCPDHPQLVTSQTWHQFAGQFGLPKVVVKSKVMLEDSADEVVLYEMIADHANLLTEELLYQWVLAGYTLTAEAKQTGLELTMSGWSHNFNQFYAEALSALTKSSPLFPVLKDLQVQLYKSIDTQQPYQVAFELLHRLILKDYVSQWERVSRLAALTEEEFQDVLGSFMNKASLEVMAVGNLTPEEARDLRETAASLYDLKTLQFKGVRVARLDKPNTFSETGGLNNNAIVNYYQFAQYDPHHWAPVLLLSKLISEASFTVLRTEQQLGYVVFADASRDLGDMGMFILVQGSYKNPQQMNEVIKDFLAALTIDPQDFEDLRDAVVTSLLIPDISLDDLTLRLWSEVATNRLEFDNASLADEVAKVKQSEVETLLATAAASKGVLSVQVFEDKAPTGIDIDYYSMRNDYFPSIARSS
jgi:insulysin